jgi:hypothetical protein
MKEDTRKKIDEASRKLAEEEVEKTKIAAEIKRLEEEKAEASAKKRKDLLSQILPEIKEFEEKLKEKIHDRLSVKCTRDYDPFYTSKETISAKYKLNEIEVENKYYLILTKDCKVMVRQETTTKTAHQSKPEIKKIDVQIENIKDLSALEKLTIEKIEELEDDFARNINTYIGKR